MVSSTVETSGERGGQLVKCSSFCKGTATPEALERSCSGIIA